MSAIGVVWLTYDADAQCTLEGREEAQMSREKNSVWIFLFFLNFGFIYLFIYFIYGCAGSSFLCEGFL